VNGVPSEVDKKKRTIYISAIGFAFVVLAVIAFMPDSKSRLEVRITKELNQKDFTTVLVPADKLVSEIVNNYYQINIIDVRNPEAFKVYHLPFAINIPIDKMYDRQWKVIIDQKHKANYFYADEMQVAEKGYLMADHLGKADNFILLESAANFRKLFSDLTPPGPDANKKEINTYNFRLKAATDMKMLVDALKNSSEPVTVKTSKIKGGC
jgi:rhodanese-related sulfurtransferase